MTKAAFVMWAPIMRWFLVRFDDGLSPNEATLAAYERVADTYQAQTQALDTRASRMSLTTRLQPRAHILDAGCGWGRDSKEFLASGFRVTAFDASQSMATKATRYLGQPVRKLRFQEVSYPPQFDAVWARASLLHIEPSQLPDAIARLLQALVPNGWLFASFKEGSGERFDARGCYYNDMTPEKFARVLVHSGGVLREVSARDDQFGRAPGWVEFLVQKPV